MRGSNIQRIEILARNYKKVVFEKIKTEFCNLKQKKKKTCLQINNTVWKSRKKWINKILHLDTLYRKCGASKDNFKAARKNNIPYEGLIKLTAI